MRIRSPPPRPVRVGRPQNFLDCVPDLGGVQRSSLPQSGVGPRGGVAPAPADRLCLQTRSAAGDLLAVRPEAAKEEQAKLGRRPEERELHRHVLGNI